MSADPLRETLEKHLAMLETADAADDRDGELVKAMDRAVTERARRQTMGVLRNILSDAALAAPVEADAGLERGWRPIPEHALQAGTVPVQTGAAEADVQAVPAALARPSGSIDAAEAIRRVEAERKAALSVDATWTAQGLWQAANILRDLAGEGGAS